MNYIILALVIIGIFILFIILQCLCKKEGTFKSLDKETFNYATGCIHCSRPVPDGYNPPDGGEPGQMYATGIVMDCELFNSGLITDEHDFHYLMHLDPPIDESQTIGQSIPSAKENCANIMYAPGFVCLDESLALLSCDENGCDACGPNEYSGCGKKLACRHNPQDGTYSCDKDNCGAGPHKLYFEIMVLDRYKIINKDGGDLFTNLSQYFQNPSYALLNCVYQAFDELRVSPPVSKAQILVDSISCIGLPNGAVCAKSHREIDELKAFILGNQDQGGKYPGIDIQGLRTFGLACLKKLPPGDGGDLNKQGACMKAKGGLTCDDNGNWILDPTNTCGYPAGGCQQCVSPDPDFGVDSCIPYADSINQRKCRKTKVDDYCADNNCQQNAFFSACSDRLWSADIGPAMGFKDGDYLSWSNEISESHVNSVHEQGCNMNDERLKTRPVSSIFNPANPNSGKRIYVQGPFITDGGHGFQKQRVGEPPSCTQTTNIEPGIDSVFHSYYDGTASKEIHPPDGLAFSWAENQKDSIVSGGKRISPLSQNIDIWELSQNLNKYHTPANDEWDSKCHKNINWRMSGFTNSTLHRVMDCDDNNRRGKRKTVWEFPLPLDAYAWYIDKGCVMQQPQHHHKKKKKREGYKIPPNQQQKYPCRYYNKCGGLKGITIIIKRKFADLTYNDPKMNGSTYQYRNLYTITENYTYGDNTYSFNNAFNNKNEPNRYDNVITHHYIDAGKIDYGTFGPFPMETRYGGTTGLPVFRVEVQMYPVKYTGNSADSASYTELGGLFTLDYTINVLLDYHTDCIPRNIFYCQNNSECGTNICVRGKCVPCTDDSQCGQGKICSNGDCFLGSRVRICNTNNDCDPKICVNGDCVSCNSDYQCGQGKICSNGDCLLGSRVRICNTNNDCDPKICANGDCVSCSNDSQCGQGKICSNGECLLGDRISSSVPLIRDVRSCMSNRDCDPQACIKSICSSCTLDSQCDQGKICSNGSCLLGSRIPFPTNRLRSFEAYKNRIGKTYKNRPSKINRTNRGLKVSNFGALNIKYSPANISKTKKYSSRDIIVGLLDSIFDKLKTTSPTKTDLMALQKEGINIRGF